jgi:bifunctional UDP-N-acetylglucosamine pyrophosphorylase/glucosamine-1-phosphate N-acetyltransferase
MLPVANVPILEHIIVATRDAGIDDFVCVVGYMGDVIRDYFGDGSRLGVHIDYVEQREQLGTAHAIGMASRSVGARFLVLNGDAIVAPPDLRALIGRKEDIVLATKELENPAGYGVVKADGDRVARLIEKPDHAAGNLVNAGIYLFSDTIFDAIRETGESVRGEYEITDSINALASVLDIGYSMLDTWIDIGRPWNLHRREL